MRSDGTRDGDLGIVLTGGGPRGAYEAGALSVLLPELARRGLRPTVYSGASVGAINALTLAGMRHLDPEEAAERGLTRWREVVMPNVMRPIVAVQGPRLAALFAGQMVAPDHVRASALLDPEPLARSLERWVDWEALRSNVASGDVRAVTALTTRIETGKSVAFVSSGDDVPPPARTIDYVGVDLAVQHVLAAASMPLLFPAVHVDRPAYARGWYADGTTRLSSPIKPALDLGARRLVVVSATPVTDRGLPGGEATTPHLGSGAAQILGGLVEDTVADDVHRLDEVNAFVRAGGAAPPGFPEMRDVPRAVVCPEAPGEIARVALEVLHENGALGGVRSLDMPLVHRLLGGDGPLQGEVLSYLMFDRDFIDELIRLGQRDASSVVTSAISTLVSER